MKSFERISDMVWTWSELHGSGHSTCEWHSFVILTPQGMPALVDPLPLSDRMIDELEKAGPPHEIFITSSWHVRDALKLANRWNSRILAHRLGKGCIEAPIGETVSEGDRLWGAARVCHLPFADVPEETGLFIESHPGVLIVGDAFCGPRTDIAVPPGEVAIYPSLRIPDPAAHASMLRRLLDLPFEVLAFGHGQVLDHDARGSLERLIGRIEKTNREPKSG